jgi:putative transposase
VPEFRRWYVPGGMYYFSVVTYRRAPIFQERKARADFAEAIRQTRRERPFQIFAMVLLHDHLHCVWTLPPGDDGYSTRWKRLKAEFTSRWLGSGGVEQPRSRSRVKKGERGVWQRRFWEHVIRDEDDLAHCCDYIHFNPVKHGYVSRPVDWRFSSFHRFVKSGDYAPDWGRTEPPGLPFFGHPE